jgi:hypothetical protein
VASRKPLVEVSGEITELPVGDTLNAPVDEVDIHSLTNGDGTAHTLGEVVYISAASTVKRAKADAAGTSLAIGFAYETVGAGAAGFYILEGVLGGLSGLTPGVRYFLSAITAGAMTTTAPSAAGHRVLELGVPLSATEFQIRIQLTIAKT